MSSSGPVKLYNNNVNNATLELPSVYFKERGRENDIERSIERDKPSVLSRIICLFLDENHMDGASNKHDKMACSIRYF